MHLDIDTLLFSSLSSRCSYLLVFVLIGTRQRGQRHMLHWAASVALSMAGAWATAKFDGAPNYAGGDGFVLFGIFGSSIVTVWSGLRVFRQVEIHWPAALVRALLPGAAYGGIILLGLPLPVALCCMFVAMAFNLLRTAWEFAAPALSTLWSRYIVAIPLLAYVLMLLVSAVTMALGRGAPPEQMQTCLSLIIDQGCSVLIYTGLLALSGEQAHTRLKQLAGLDLLTSLANRHGLAMTLDRWAAERPGPTGLTSVALFDIDHFKAINDGHGHGTGDAVLVEFSRRARQVFATTPDLLVRWGGEEFLVLMRDTDRDTALRRAEALRAAIESAPFRIGALELAVTVSGGVAETQAGPADLDGTVARADAALYLAKGQGRNRVAAASERAGGTRPPAPRPASPRLLATPS